MARRPHRSIGAGLGTGFVAGLVATLGAGLGAALVAAGVAACLSLFACAEPAVPAVCSSGRMIGTSEGSDMAPGQPCNDCHAYTNAGGDGIEAPIFGFAGTVYRTAHEPDDCAGGTLDAAGADRAQVEVVSATGQRLVAPVTDGGNFMFEDTAIAFPITARVRYRGRSRWMVEPQMTGECNSCHSADGQEGASGRIRLP